MKKGIFIVFEGPDRAGKSTQIKLLSKKLKNGKIPFILTREPGGSELSEKIRRILLNPHNKISPLSELFLYEASRAQHVKETVIPALNKGKVVISDRFSLASTAYQGFGRNIPVNTVQKLNDIATGGLKPDLTVVLLIRDKQFAKRGEKIKSDRMEMESAKFRRKVNKAYFKLSKNKKNFLIIKADGKIEDIQKRIIRSVLRKLNIKRTKCTA